MHKLLSAFVLAAFALPAAAQIVPVAPFTGDAAENFEAQPPQNGVQCLLPRIFGERADLCAASGLGLGVAGGFGLSGTIFAHSGVQCAADGTAGMVITFDAPVQSFGGWFGTIASSSNGSARFYDSGNALIGMQPIAATACMVNCGWTWNGWNVSSGPLIKHIELGTGNGSGAGLALDDLVAQFGALATGTPFCSGDGSAHACPCNNTSADAPRGCLNSSGHGARLTAGGVASLTSDSVVLYASDMGASSPHLFFQGTNQVAIGAQVFGDGLRCAGGSIVRLAERTSVNGTSHYPGSTDPELHVRGQIMSPGVRTYQVWYRDPATFCTTLPFNLTNGYEITWQS